MRSLVSLFVVIVSLFVLPISCSATEKLLSNCNSSGELSIYPNREIEFYEIDTELKERIYRKIYRQQYNKYREEGYSAFRATILASEDARRAVDSKYDEYRKKYEEYRRAGYSATRATFMAQRDVYGD